MSVNILILYMSLGYFTLLFFTKIFIKKLNYETKKINQNTDLIIVFSIKIEKPHLY